MCARRSPWARRPNAVQPPMVAVASATKTIAPASWSARHHQRRRVRGATGHIVRTHYAWRVRIRLMTPSDTRALQRIHAAATMAGYGRILTWLGPIVEDPATP